MAAIFRKLADSDEDAMQLALEFYGPMYLLYSVYDGAEEKEFASSLLATHIDRFIAKVESDYRKKGRTTWKMAKKKSAASFFEGAEIVYLGWIMAGLVKGYAVAVKRYRVCAMLTTRRGLNSLKSLFQQKKCC